MQMPNGTVKCLVCDGVGRYWIPGQHCNFCDGRGYVHPQEHDHLWNPTDYAIWLADAAVLLRSLAKRVEELEAENARLLELDKDHTELVGQMNAKLVSIEQQEPAAWMDSQGELWTAYSEARHATHEHPRPLYLHPAPTPETLAPKPGEKE